MPSPLRFINFVVASSICGLSEWSYSSGSVVFTRLGISISLLLRTEFIHIERTSKKTWFGGTGGTTVIAAGSAGAAIIMVNTIIHTQHMSNHHSCNRKCFPLTVSGAIICAERAPTEAIALRLEEPVVASLAEWIAVVVHVSISPQYPLTPCR